MPKLEGDRPNVVSPYGQSDTGAQSPRGRSSSKSSRSPRSRPPAPAASAPAAAESDETSLVEAGPDAQEADVHVEMAEGSSSRIRAGVEGDLEAGAQEQSRT